MELSMFRCSDLAQLKPPPAVPPGDFSASRQWLKMVVINAQTVTNDLFSYFRLDRKHDLTVKIMSIKDDLLARLFPGSRRLTVAIALAETGDPGASGGTGSQQDAALQAAYLYYSVLHNILRRLFPKRVEGNTTSRFNCPTVAPEAVPQVVQLLMIPVFHTSLLVVAAALVQAVWTQDPRCLGSSLDEFLLITRRAGLQHNMMAVWNACRWFIEIFVTDVPRFDGHAANVEAGPEMQLPPMPGRYVLGRLMRLCEEREVMTEGSTFYPIYSQLGGMEEGVNWGFSVGDENLALAFVKAYTARAATLSGFIAKKLLDLVMQREVQQRQQTVHVMGTARVPILNKAQQPLVPLESFPKLAAKLVDTIMTTNFQLVFNQHMFVILACCLYSAAKASRIKVSFAEITGLFVDVLPDITASVFETQVELEPAVPGMPSTDPAFNTSAPAIMGGIRPFYNSIFLPCVEDCVRDLVNHASKRSFGRPNTSSSEHSDGQMGSAQVALEVTTGNAVTTAVTTLPVTTAAPCEGWTSLHFGVKSSHLPVPDKALGKATDAANSVDNGLFVASRRNAHEDRSKACLVPKRPSITSRHEAHNLLIYEDDCDVDTVHKDVGACGNDHPRPSETLDHGKESAKRPSAPLALRERKPAINWAVSAATAYTSPSKDGQRHIGDACKLYMEPLTEFGMLPAAMQCKGRASKENVVAQAKQTVGETWLGAADRGTTAGAHPHRNNLRRIR